jgi:hypothetical protein
LSDTLSKLMNEVRAFAQRQQEAMQQQQGQNGQQELLPEDAVRLKGQLLISQAKADNMRESHAQRSQQRQEIHQQNMQERQATDELANASTIRKTQVDESAKDLETAAEIQRQANKPAPAPKSA